MQQRFISLALLLSIAVSVRVFSAEAIELDEADSSVKYQKAIAPYIETAAGTYHDAELRFEAGLPHGDQFYVIARITRVRGVCALTVVRVSNIDKKEMVIRGQIERIENELKTRVGFKKGDQISLPSSTVIDWKITHSDGRVEGDVVGKYLASLGPNVSGSDLLVDQRDFDMRSLEASQTIENAFGQVYLQFFDDKDLKVEAVASDPPTIKEWPSLTRKFHGTAPEALVAELTNRAEAIKATKKVVVELTGLEGKPIVLVQAYVVLKKGNTLFEFRQFLHFQYRKADELEKVFWGARIGRWMDLKPKVSQVSEPKSASATSPAASRVAPPVGAGH